MKARGWKETEGDDWDFFYGDVAWIHENMTYHVRGLCKAASIRRIARAQRSGLRFDVLLLSDQ
jgi:hypothetical protein